MMIECPITHEKFDQYTNYAEHMDKIRLFHLQEFAQMRQTVADVDDLVQWVESNPRLLYNNFFFSRPRFPSDFKVDSLKFWMKNPLLKLDQPTTTWKSLEQRGYAGETAGWRISFHLEVQTPERMPFLISQLFEGTGVHLYYVSEVRRNEHYSGQLVIFDCGGVLVCNEWQGLQNTRLIDELSKDHSAG